MTSQDYYAIFVLFSETDDVISSVQTFKYATMLRVPESMVNLLNLSHTGSCSRVAVPI